MPVSGPPQSAPRPPSSINADHLIASIRLLALDVDGTLIDGSVGTVSDRVKHAVRKVNELMPVCLCTGRSPEQTREVAEELALKPSYHAVGGGSTILRP